MKKKEIKIEDNQVVSKKFPIEFEGEQDAGVNIKSYLNDEVNIKNSIDDDVDIEKLIQPHKHLMTFEAFSQNFCGCCEECNCDKNSTECFCQCYDCVCQTDDIKSIGEGE